MHQSQRVVAWLGATLVLVPFSSRNIVTAVVLGNDDAIFGSHHREQAYVKLGKKDKEKQPDRSAALRQELRAALAQQGGTNSEFRQKVQSEELKTVDREPTVQRELQAVRAQQPDPEMLLQHELQSARFLASQATQGTPRATEKSDNLRLQRELQDARAEVDQLKGALRTSALALQYASNLLPTTDADNTGAHGVKSQPLGEELHQLRQPGHLEQPPSLLEADHLTTHASRRNTTATPSDHFTSGVVTYELQKEVKAEVGEVLLEEDHVVAAEHRHHFPFHREVFVCRHSALCTTLFGTVIGLLFGFLLCIGLCHIRTLARGQPEDATARSMWAALKALDDPKLFPGCRTLCGSRRTEKADVCENIAALPQHPHGAANWAGAAEQDRGG